MYLVLTLPAVFALVPAYVMVLTSLKPPAEGRHLAHVGPAHRGSLAAWAQAWATLRPYLLNSLRLAIPATVLSALLGSLNGYVFARWRFPGSETDFNLLLFGLFIAVSITSAAQRPVMVALQNLSGSQIVEWNVQMAAAALPTLIICVLLGRYFVRGLLAGAMKG